MTSHRTGDDSPSSVSEPIIDHESLRDDEEIPFHEKRDVVDEAVVEQVAELADLAGVGITNDEGELLFRRLTDTCSWKIPVAAVDPEADFVTAIREQVGDRIGFTVELEAVEGVWDIRVETENGEQTASRAFVTFSGSPVSDGYDLADISPEGESVEDAGWFDDLPDGADEIPGTNHFLD